MYCEVFSYILFTVWLLFQVYFDNWFFTLDLLIEIKEVGILSTATSRSNRLAGCPVKSESN